MAIPRYTVSISLPAPVYEEVQRRAVVSGITVHRCLNRLIASALYPQPSGAEDLDHVAQQQRSSRKGEMKP